MFLVICETFCASLSLKHLFDVLLKGTGGNVRGLERDGAMEIVLLHAEVLSNSGVTLSILALLSLFRLCLSLAVCFDELLSNSVFSAHIEIAVIEEFRGASSPAISIALIEVEDAIGDNVLRSTGTLEFK